MSVVQREVWMFEGTRTVPSSLLPGRLPGSWLTILLYGLRSPALGLEVSVEPCLV